MVDQLRSYTIKWLWPESTKTRSVSCQYEREYAILRCTGNVIKQNRQSCINMYATIRGKEIYAIIFYHMHKLIYAIKFYRKEIGK